MEKTFGVVLFFSQFLGEIVWTMKSVPVKRHYTHTLHFVTITLSDTEQWQEQGSSFHPLIASPKLDEPKLSFYVVEKNEMKNQIRAQRPAKDKELYNLISDVMCIVPVRNVCTQLSSQFCSGSLVQTWCAATSCKKLDLSLLDFCLTQKIHIHILPPQDWKIF